MSKREFKKSYGRQMASIITTAVTIMNRGIRYSIAANELKLLVDLGVILVTITVLSLTLAHNKEKVSERKNYAHRLAHFTVLPRTPLPSQ